MITIDEDLQELIDFGRSEYPLLVCTKDTGETHVFTASDIWNGQFEIDRYRSVGKSPEIGTAVAAEIDVSLRYEAGFLEYFSDGWDMCAFVGVREHWNYDQYVIDAKVSVARTVDQVQDIIDNFPYNDWSYVLYVGDNGDITVNGESERINYGMVARISRASTSTVTVVTFRPIVPMGIFYADSVENSKTNIRVTGLDCMTFLDKPADLIGVGTARCGTFSYGFYPDNPYAVNPRTLHKLTSYNDATDEAFQDYITPFAVVANRIENKTGINVARTWREPTESGSLAYQPYIYGDQVTRFSDYTYRQLLQYIGQLTGTWFYVRAFERKLIACEEIKTSVNESIEITPEITYSFKLNSLAPISINNIVIKDASGEYTSAVGVGDIDYVISGNPMLKNVPRNNLKSVYVSRIAQVFRDNNMTSYQPFTASIVQRPYLELSDFAKVYYPDDTSVVTPITRINYRLNEAMTIECAGNNDTTSSLGSGSSGTSSTTAKNLYNNASAASFVTDSKQILYANDSGLAPGATPNIADIGDYTLYSVTLIKGATKHNLLCTKDYTTDGLNAIAGSLITIDSGTRYIYTARISFRLTDSAQNIYACYVNTAESSINAADCTITQIIGII